MSTTQNSKVHAALLLDPHSLHYQVKMLPDEALAFTNELHPYNDFSPELAAKLLEKINALIPPMAFGPNNPNNGHPHHSYRVGREASRVLYLDIVKAYMTGYDYTELAGQLKVLGRTAKADEMSITENDEGMFSFRFWWD